MANEEGRAQAEPAAPGRRAVVCGRRFGGGGRRPSELERSAAEGESPVGRRPPSAAFLRPGVGLLESAASKGGRSHPKLNTAGRPIAQKYCEGKVKRTLKRGSKVLEIAGGEARAAFASAGRARRPLLPGGAAAPARRPPARDPGGAGAGASRRRRAGLRAPPAGRAPPAASPRGRGSGPGGTEASRGAARPTPAALGPRRPRERGRGPRAGAGRVRRHGAGGRRREGVPRPVL